MAFVTDTFARRIVGWQTGTSMSTDFVLDALEQALHARQPEAGTLTHHGNRGSQYLPLRYTERLRQAGVAASVGSTGDAFDNALTETINGLYKTELIRPRGPWKSRQQLELATLDWVHWSNNQRLLQSIGEIPPVEAEAKYFSKRAIERAWVLATTLTSQPPRLPEMAWSAHPYSPQLPASCHSSSSATSRHRRPPCNPPQSCPSLVWIWPNRYFRCMP